MWKGVLSGAAEQRKGMAVGETEDDLGWGQGICNPPGEEQEA